MFGGFCGSSSFFASCKLTVPGPVYGIFFNPLNWWANSDGVPVVVSCSAHRRPDYLIKFSVFEQSFSSRFVLIVAWRVCG